MWESSGEPDNPPSVRGRCLNWRIPVGYLSARSSPGRPVGPRRRRWVTGFHQKFLPMSDVRLGSLQRFHGGPANGWNRRSLAVGVRVGYRLELPPFGSFVDSGRLGRVGMWRDGGRPGMSVSAPFVWRCLSCSTIAPFPHPAHRTGHADCPHPALGQDFTPSPTTGRAHAGSDVRARSTRRGARVDTSRLGVA